MSYYPDHLQDPRSSNIDPKHRHLQLQYYFMDLNFCIDFFFNEIKQ
jgi:hypothetical protein